MYTVITANTTYIAFELLGIASAMFHVMHTIQSSYQRNY